ncbi:MAG: creatininase family protein [Armatimonadota bacterium]
MPERVMEFMTIEDMEEALAETQTAIISIGGTEQHGLHLPLKTDILTVYEAAKAAARETGCLAASPIYYSYSGGTRKGTTDISPALTTLLVTEIAESLMRQGVRNIIIATGHGGRHHLDAICLAGEMLERRHTHLRVVVPRLDRRPKYKEAFDAGDHHAGMLETSVLLYLAAELVRTKDRGPATEETTGTDVRYEPDWDVGVSGDPLKASGQLGEELFNEWVDELSTIVREMEAARRDE